METKSGLVSLLDGFTPKHLLLIGDFIVDIHHRGRAVGLSGEAPVVVAHDEGSDVTFGGAALVAANALALGGKVTFLFRVGEDEHARYPGALRHPNLTTRVFRDPGYATVVKERFVVNGQKVLRWDRGNAASVSETTERALLDHVERTIDACDTIVVSDYRHGFLSERLASGLVSMARKRNKPLYVDSQVRRDSSNHAWYRGATLLCLNEGEARAISSGFDPASLPLSLTGLSARLGGGDIVVKLGADGSAGLIEGRCIPARPFRVQTVDTVGAGDAFLAVLALIGERPSQAELELANIWAALSTTIAGTGPPTMAMLRDSVHIFEDRRHHSCSHTASTSTR